MKTCPFCAEEIQEAAVVCKHCKRDLALPPPMSDAPRANAAPEQRSSRSRQLGLIAVLAALTLVAVATWSGADQSTGGVPSVAPPIGRPPLTVSVVDTSALEIAAGSYTAWQWSGDGRRSCHLTGRVLGLAGGNKDVYVMLMNEDGFINFKNNNDYKVYFESGKQAAVTLDLGVSGNGRYVLVVSNAHSLLTAKTVQLQDIRAECAD